MFGLPTPSFTLEVSIGPVFAWVIFGLALLFFFLVTISLTHHWKKFTFDAGVLQKVTRAYYTVTTILICISLASLLLYTISIPR